MCARAIASSHSCRRTTSRASPLEPDLVDDFLLVLINVVHVFYCKFHAQVDLIYDPLLDRRNSLGGHVGEGHHGGHD